MPLYEYHCPSCQTKFELLRPYQQADSPTSCPNCQASASRTISAFASFSRGEAGIPVPVANRGGGGGCCGGG